MSFVNLGTRNKATLWAWAEAYSFGHTILPPETNFAFSGYLAVGEGEGNQHTRESQELADNTEVMIREFKRGIYSEKFFQALITIYTTAFQELKTLCLPPYTSLNNEALAQKVELGTKLVGETFLPMMMASHAHFLEDFFTSEVEKVIKKEEDLTQVQTLLLTLTQPTIAQNEEDALFLVEVKYKQEKLPFTAEAYENFCHQATIKKDFEKIVADFGWFHMEYGKEPFTALEYQEYLKDLIFITKEDSRKSPSQIRQESAEKQKDFFAQHPHSEELEKLVQVLQQFSFVLDHSKAITVHGIYTMWPLLTEVAERLNLNIQDLLYLDPTTITAWLAQPTQVNPHLITERKNFRTILMQGEKMEINQGEKAREIAKKYLASNPESEKSHITGKIGYPGVVQGKVSVIHSIADRPKFKKGDVLVTQDGTAELTIFLKEASAIVTDQGGIISHAAIIAREMKTPCIVGTGNATHILRDGDLVEVNADSGTVTKLS